LQKPFTAYKGDEPYLFVCYAHEDAAAVYPEIEWLDQQGINIWYDEGISAGRIWRNEIAEAIQGASKLLYYVSKNSIASEHCNREVDYALDKAFDIVPIFLEETQLTPELDLALNRVQALHRKVDAHYQQRLLDAVGGTAALEPLSVAPRSKSRTTTSAGLVLLVAVVAAIAWFGFSFDTTSNDATSNDATSNDTTSNASSIRSIAVLPLENLSADPDQEYFSDGTTDMLIHELRKIRSLGIISRQSVVQYKNSSETASNIAAALKVDGLLTGTVTKTPNLIRFNLQLYNASTDRVIWTESLDRSPTHILSLQSDIAKAVSQQINIKLSSEERSLLNVSREIDPESHRAYLRGQYQINTLRWDLAKESFEKAIALDPTNSDALAALAGYTLIQIWNGASSHELLPKVRSYTKAALAIDPNSSYGQANEAAVSLFFDERNYQKSINRFSDLLARHPDDLNILMFYRITLEIIGELDLAIILSERMIELDPLDASSVTSKGRIYRAAGKYDKARTAFELSESLGNPNAGDLAELAILQRDKESLALQLARDAQDWVGTAFWIPVQQSWAAWLDGDMQKVQELVKPYDTEEGVTSWFYLSYFPRVLGDYERAIAYHSRALDNGEPWALIRILGSVGEHELIPEYYNHPDYQAMLLANGLDPASVAKLNIPPLPF